MSLTLRTALGTGALFLGGLLGGLLGSALFTSRGAAPVPDGGGSERVVVAHDAELRAAIEALTQELRVREVPIASNGSERAIVGGDGAPAPADFGELAAAMDRLADAIARSPAASGGGGIGLTPLALPPPGNRPDRLRALLAMDDEEASRQFRLWTYQQVLDHFGRPDSVREGGIWTYVLTDPGDRNEFNFRFMDGFLSGIYY